MADAKIINYGQQISAGSTAIPDNTSEALDIESTDGKNWIVANTTNDADELLFLSSFTASDNESAGLLGIRTDDPKAIVHIVGKGGKSDESMLPAITADASPTMVIDNGGGNGSDRCSFVMNGNGSQGSIIDMYQDTDRKLIIQATDTTSEIRSNDCHLELDTSGTAYDLVLKTNNTERMRIDGGAGTTAIAGSTVITATTSHTPDNLADFDNYALVLEGSSNSNNETGLLLASSGTGNGGSAIVHKDTGGYGKGELNFYTKQSEGAGAPLLAFRIGDDGVAHAIQDMTTAVNGTFTATQGSDVINAGSSTVFRTQLHVGAAIKIPSDHATAVGGFEFFTVDGITSDTILSLDSNYLGSNRETSGGAFRDGGELFAVKTGDSKTLFSVQPTGAIGAGANANSDSGVYNNIGIGDPRMFDKLTTGNALFVMGCTSGDYDFTTANACVIIGYGAAGDSATSQNLVAIGSYAADSDTDIRESVIIGSGAGRSSGNDSVHVGHEAGASCTGVKNVSIGRNALDNSSAATESTAVGYQSLSALSGAVESNSGFGFQSGLALTSGQQCTFLGAETDTSAATENNQTAIGYGAVTDALNQVRLGNTTVADIDGQVALTATSDARVKTNVENLSIGLDFINALRPVSFTRVHPADWPVEIRDERYKKGRTVVDEDGNETIVSTVNFDVETQQPIKDEFDSTTKSDGLIAQEVKAVCESLGVEFNGIKQNKNGKMGIQYSLLVSPLIKAVQELSARVSELEAGD